MGDSCRFVDDGVEIFNERAIGCNAVPWAPEIHPGSLISPQTQGTQSTLTTASVKRFASTGCDNPVRIWGYREDSKPWVEEETLEGSDGYHLDKKKRHTNFPLGQDCSQSLFDFDVAYVHRASSCCQTS